MLLTFFNVLSINKGTDIMRDLLKAKSKLELPEGTLSSVMDAMADLHPQIPMFLL